MLRFLKREQLPFIFSPLSLSPWATLKPSSPMKTLSKDKRFLILLKKPLLGMSHCTKLKINLENIGKNNNNNKEPVWCEKTFCEHIKIGKQGRAFLKWICKDLFGQSLSIAGPAAAPPVLLQFCTESSHISWLFPITQGELACQIHLIAPTPGNVVVLCVNLGADLPCSRVRA